MQALTTSKLVEIYFYTDEFIKQIASYLQAKGDQAPHWPSRFSRSEVMTVLISYHTSGLINLKTYYKQEILGNRRCDFPDAPCYHRFVSLIQHVIPELYFLLRTRLLPASKANYVDSKPLKVCHIRRERSHKVFRHTAAKGKGSMGWFYGFKLHLVVRHDGKLSDFILTAGNVADNNQKLLRELIGGKQACFYGDKGYNSALKSEFAQEGTHLIAKLRNNQNLSLPVGQEDAYYLRRRGLIESVIERLVGLGDIEHSRHRSPHSFLANLFAGLLAYSFADKVPSIESFKGSRIMKIEMKNVA